MSKISRALHSFHIKVTLVLVLTLIFVTALSNFFIYKYAFNNNFEQLRDKLKIVAQTAAIAIDVDALKAVPLGREGFYTPEFRIVADKLLQIKEANTPIKYIYTLAKTDQPGMLQFAVDPQPPSLEEEQEGITAYPGDEYDASRFPEMLRAFNAPTADRKILEDEWGPTLSGYAPIRDDDKKVIAILGVDIAAKDVFRMQKELKHRGSLVLGVGLVFSLILGLMVSERITRPVQKLIKGTRRIAAGDLQYQVSVKGSDEISELAKSFNEMSNSLYTSQEQLHDYFYRAMQSLVRILEAKDVYTRGHSDRVAEYSEKIARAMGLDDKKIDVVKKMALLHDIGKLAVHEEILNKKGKLTAEEWKEVREHPVVGEHILEPIVLDKEMLKIIRSHHEYYDGTGYPDHLSHEHINILAQIVTVADSYDAMTSDRAYRPALSKEKAIALIKSGSGKQFNPKIVEAFVKIQGGTV